MIKLPQNIDYTLYHNTSGMSTKHFGPQTWDFLFISILGRYPVKIDKNNKKHIKIAHTYHDLLTSLNIVLPCIYCRKSYTHFLKELPIKPYLKGRITLFYWLYLIKDKVNKKLILQENKLYTHKKNKLKILYKKQKITKQKYKQKLQKLKSKIFQTIDTPPFEIILNKYEKLRANCTTKLKTCKIKNTKN